MNKKVMKRVYNIIVVALLLLGVAYVVTRFVHLGRVEYTNNAQVYRRITPVNTRVQGFVKEIRFEDYQEVKQGDTLVVLEDAEYRLQLAQAEANVRGSASGGSAIQASINTTESNVSVAQASIEEAEVELSNASRDFERYENLLAKGAVTQQQYDNAKARYEAAKARYARADNQRRSTALMKQELGAKLSQSGAALEVAENAVNLARLNLSYTVITAPCDGRVGRKTLSVGQLVQPGQTLVELVEKDNVWVVANYRESQLKHVAVGNSVEVTADAVPGTTYEGVVETLAGATGSALSKTPTDNAAGNFVKVEQRVPVKIRLCGDDLDALLAGMNCEVKVKY